MLQNCAAKFKMLALLLASVMLLPSCESAAFLSSESPTLAEICRQDRERIEAVYEDDPSAIDAMFARVVDYEARCGAL
jgi:hypothetical protein